MLRNIAEERSSHLFRGGRLKLITKPVKNIFLACDGTWRRRRNLLIWWAPNILTHKNCSWMSKWIFRGGRTKLWPPPSPEHTKLILSGMTMQEIISSVKCIVYLPNEQKDLNKNATHKGRHILLIVNFRVTEAHFHCLHFIRRCFRVSGIHYYKIAIPMSTSWNYAKKFLIKWLGHGR